MKKHNDQPNEFNDFRKTPDAQPPQNPNRMPGPIFEEGLSGFICFWRNIGCPDLTVLYRVLFWEDHEHDRQATADAVGLPNRESVRQMIIRLKEVYIQHTQPAPPYQKRHTC